MQIPFIKMSGAGNDFLLVDRMGEGVPAPWLPSVPAMCDRRRGVGADGVIILAPAVGADFTMEYFNADGSAGSMCGNGGRCASAFMMDRLARDSVSFMACGRLYRAARSPHGVSLEMEDPGRPRMNIPIRLGGEVDLVGHFIDTGSPHMVVRVDTGAPDHSLVVEIGRKIRHHPEFGPSGTNVDFMTVMGHDELQIRTYERGVEDETWACGTGAVAAAMIHSMLDGVEGERVVRVVPLSGETLHVSFRRAGSSITLVTLDGPAAVTFSGIYETE